MTHLSCYQLSHIKFYIFKIYAFLSTWLISTQPHLNVIASWGGQLFHEPWRVVEGTAGVQSTTALPIPERIIGIEYPLVSTFTGSVTEVVTPHKGWDGDGHWAVDVGAGADIMTIGWNLIKSSYKSPYVFPGVMSMCEANTIHIGVIDCETTVAVIVPECIWCLLLVANDLTTHVCTLHHVSWWLQKNIHLH